MAKNPVTYAEVFRYLSGTSSEKYAEGCSEARKRSIRRFAVNFVLEEGILFYVKRENEKRRWIYDKHMQEQIIVSLHDDAAGGCHFGRDKTRDKVISRYYWHSQYEDVDNYVKTCERCQKTNPKFHKPMSQLKPIPIVSTWDRIGIDLIGPLPTTKNGNKYIITCTDYYSKWVEAGPLPTKESKGVANFLYSLFCRHGVPKKIQSDQGREFVNSLGEHLFELTGVKHIISSAYHPQTNGLVERFNQTLQRSLLKMIGKNENHWEDFLESVLFAYRTSRQASTKYSPFYVMYGREPRLPVDLLISEEGDSDACNSKCDLKFEDINEHVTKFIELRKKLDVNVKGNVHKAQARQKKQYDARHQPGSYKVGQLVLLKNMRKLSKKGDKMKPNWTGPFEVFECIGNHNYRLKKGDGKKALKVIFNGTRLKLFNERAGVKTNELLSDSETPSESSHDQEPPNADQNSPKQGHFDSMAPPPMEAIEVNQSIKLLQQALTDQLMDDSLLRLWKTGGDLCAPDPMDDDQTDLSSYLTDSARSRGEYGLSMDLQVSLWLDYRNSNNQTTLTDVGDFVIVNSQLHDEFDQFKKAEMKPLHSLLPLTELLKYYCLSCAQSSLLHSFGVSKFGKKFLELKYSQVDSLIEWLYTLRDQYNDDGENVFVPTLLKEWISADPKLTDWSAKENPSSIIETPLGSTVYPQPSKDLHKPGEKRKNPSALEKPEKKKKKKITASLSKKSIKEVKKGYWLADDHIKVASGMLKNQFPKLAGLFSTVLGQNLSFPVCKEPFIQVLHVGDDHWVTVASVSSNLVHLYDSLYDVVHIDTKMQIAAMMHTNDPHINVLVHKIQFQRGSSDCGLYSIAYATDVAHGNDPASFKYKQELLRSHFLTSLEKNELIPFPSEVICRKKPKKICISIMCTCRLPDNGKEKMAQCRNCREWFHKSCEGIPKEVFHHHDAVWKCSVCFADKSA